MRVNAGAVLSHACLQLSHLSLYSSCRRSTAVGVQMSYPISMDHLEVLREKIGSLRMEIAHIQELNAQYRLRHGNVTEAQVAHGQIAREKREGSRSVGEIPSEPSPRIRGLDQRREAGGDERAPRKGGAQTNR